MIRNLTAYLQVMILEVTVQALLDNLPAIKFIVKAKKIDNERNFAVLTDISIPALENYHIHGTFDGDFNLALWQFLLHRQI